MKCELSRCVWSPCDPPKVKVEVTFPEEGGTRVRMISDRLPTRAVNTLPQSSVWEDDCLEFFYEKDGGYVNLEANANGALRAAWGPDRNNRSFIDYAYVSTRITETGWEAVFTTPDTAVKANFYACADKAEKPYYASWREIKTPEPDFHRPEFFGIITE